MGAQKSEYFREHYMKNRERILEKKREYYHNNKDEICFKYRIDKVECPLCIGVLYRRSYLQKHLETRHNKTCVSCI